ncbi:MAG: M14 family zinc carboxypeptidase [Vicinamibacteria bacterium]
MLAAIPLLLLAAAPPLPDLAPGARYDSRIPTLAQVAGHAVSDEVSSPEEIVAYLKALAAAAPERTRLVRYAESWEGRPLYYLAIASPERMARIDAVKAGLRRLADPRGLPAGEAEALVRELPVVTWLIHGVHGNEASSGGAAMALAHHLLAAQGDAEADRILRESVVLIDPMQNPDGRARFVFQHRLGRASVPDAEPAAADHDEPWPGGRSNHYLFDLNRDWFALAHPESRGRVAVGLEWQPQVTVDLHEMGGDSTYYFPPAAPPPNPHRSAKQGEWLDAFGRANADRFDARGFAYFIREVFDAFYPGYGTSWPMMQGSIGMTYEQASSRGLVYRRRDGTLLSYGDGVLHHFTAALQTAATAAANRERLLGDFLAFRRTAIADGERGATKEYVLLPGGDPARAARLARLLVAQGASVRRLDEPVTAGARTLPAGSYAVPLAQPSGRLVRNLLDPQAPIEPAFLKEQERRRALRLNDQIYDVTAWSLPLLWDVESVAVERPLTVRSTPVETPPGEPQPFVPPAVAGASLPPARVGYLMPWNSATAAAVVEALGAGLRVRSADLPFSLAGRRYAGGTAILRASENLDLHERLAAIAARHGAETAPFDSAFVEEGLSLGSNQVVPLASPRVLLLWDTPAQSLSAGWARYVLERRYGVAVSAVRVASLRRVELSRYDVIVAPSGDYASAVAGDALERLKDWLRRGGTLVTLGEASRWAARDKTGLLSSHFELRDGRAEDSAEERGKSEPAKGPFDLEKAITPERERPENTPGALLRVALDAAHWLSAGSDGEIQAIVEGQRVLAPIRLDKGRNVGLYAKQDRLVASGLVWPEGQAQLAQKAYLVHEPVGQGHVIAFAEDPNFRAYAEATMLLFINAVLLGPAH